MELRGERRALAPERFGIWSATLEATHGDRYRYLLGDAAGLSDPASRWQPEGLRGPSAVVDPGTFTWTDGDWAGVAVEELVLYELHVDAFTPEGTFDAAAAHLPELAELGVTAALGDRLAGELRPLAAFATLLSPFVPMLWMGEEYGEPAPFQFFSDHIDEEIATATRDGRRREFASFAAFAGEEVPDPQDPATFARSKLTRERDAALLALHRELLRVRRELPQGDAQASGDEEGRWVRVVRGPYELCMNFGAAPVRVPSAGDRLALATHPDATSLEPGGVRLPSRAGALVRA